VSTVYVDDGGVNEFGCKISWSKGFAHRTGEAIFPTIPSSAHSEDFKLRAIQ